MKYQTVSPDVIELSNLRENRDLEKQAELEASIAAIGIRIPTITFIHNGRLRNVDGDGRTIAAQKLGQKIPTLILDADPGSDTQLAAQVGRSDLTPWEWGRALDALIDSEKLSLSEIGSRFGIAEMTASRYLKIYRDRYLGPARHKMTTSQLVATGTLADKPDTRARVIERSVNEHLTRAETEMLAEAVAQAPAEIAEQLLEEPVRKATHSIEAVAKRATKKKKSEKSQTQKEIEVAKKLPGVADMLRELAKRNTYLGYIQKSIRLGVLASEGIPFVLKKLYSEEKKLSKTIAFLEERNPTQQE